MPPSNQSTAAQIEFTPLSAVRIVLGASDEVVAKMKVLSVLESLPGLGKVKARRLMRDGHHTP